MDANVNVSCGYILLWFAVSDSEVVACRLLIKLPLIE